MKSIWIARDKDGDIWMFENKPKRSHSSDGWSPEGGDFMELIFDDFDWFPEVTWEGGPIKLVVEEKKD